MRTLLIVLAVWLPATVVALAVEPSDAPSPKRDFHGDPLPRHALARLGTVRFRPLAEVWAMDFSPDGKLIATGTYPGSMHEELELWDASTGQRVGSLLAGTNNIICIAFSPDGKQLAISHDRRVDIFDVATRKLRKNCKPKRRRKTAIAHSGR